MKASTIVTNVIHVDFRQKPKDMLFSADVYSHDMKKYQFEISTRSIIHAYRLFIDEAKKLGVHFVRCIAVYRGKVQKRLDFPEPIRVWQQDWQMRGLREY